MSRQSYETIHIEKRGDADWLTLNRPESLNAISLQMVHDLSDYFGRLFNDRQTRVVVMRAPSSEASVRSSSSSRLARCSSLSRMLCFMVEDGRACAAARAAVAGPCG